ncbi:MAG: putative selenium-dependent hydroxylase accessory protein YqeC [Tissierellia bacterium]|nr:selenium cofactor biosynthesis protein YqeC [Bacillota bacterium]NLK58578.1 putative selenium-dependent hydroxylase accessory protein YqeC [Tissierellia bacterium]
MHICRGDLLASYEAAGLLPSAAKGIAFAGGGGKTSSLYRLAAEYAAKGERVCVSTTTRMEKPDGNWLSARRDLPQDPVPGKVYVAGADVHPVKIGPPDFLDALPQLFDRVLLETDGAKRMPVKVPAENEPIVPPWTDALVVVAGLSALEKPLQEVCFRIRQVTEILNKSPEDTLGVQDLATLLREGYGKPWLSCYPGGIVLNQADTPRALALAKEIALLLPEYSVVAQYLLPAYRYGFRRP